MTDNAGRSKGAVYDFLSQRFGGSLREIVTFPTGEIASSVIAPRDNERISLMIMNLGGVEVFLCPEKAPTLLAGIRVPANGGGVAYNVTDDGVLPALEWLVISSVAATQLMVIGVRREART